MSVELVANASEVRIAGSAGPRYTSGQIARQLQYCRPVFLTGYICYVNSQLLTTKALKKLLIYLAICVLLSESFNIGINVLLKIRDGLCTLVDRYVYLSPQSDDLNSFIFFC